MLVPSLANGFHINPIQQSFTIEKVLIRSHFIVHCSMILIQVPIDPRQEFWHEYDQGEVKENLTLVDPRGP